MILVDGLKENELLKDTTKIRWAFLMVDKREIQKLWPGERSIYG